MTGLVSSHEDKETVGTQIQGKRPLEDRVRRVLSASQGGRPQEKPALRVM